MRQLPPASARRFTDFYFLQHLADDLCLHHELHEYDQDEDLRRAYAPNVLRSHEVFTFRKVLVAIERLGDLFSQRMDVWPGSFFAGCFAWRGPGSFLCVCLSIGQ